jgi:hypothetical protein
VTVWRQPPSAVRASPARQEFFASFPNLKSGREFIQLQNLTDRPSPLDLGTAELRSARTAGGGCPHMGCAEVLILWTTQHYGSRPKTATPVGVPTNTLPFTIMGVMNLLPLPNWSRPLLAWLLL